MELIEVLLPTIITIIVLVILFIVYKIGRYHENKSHEEEWIDLNEIIDKSLLRKPLFIETNPNPIITAFTVNYSRSVNDQQYRDEGITIDLPQPIIILEDIAEQR